MTVQDHGLRVIDVSKTFAENKQTVFKNVSFELAHNGRLALLGRNGQGKSTLIRMLGGNTPPTTGKIIWRMKPSWPIGFAGGFQGSLSGLDNVRFLSRLYDRDYHEVLHIVDDFAELGSKLKDPVKHYSSGMRARLAFGLSIAIEFDCYLIDELVAVGDARFQQKCQEALFEKRANRAFLMASHNMHLIEEHCDRALIIESGKAKIFDDIKEAIEIYTWLRAS